MDDFNYGFDKDELRIYKKIKEMDRSKFISAGFAYFFAFNGLAILFADLLSAYSSIGLKKSQSWARLIAISSGLFAVIGGIGAVGFAKFGNPLIYVMSICAASNVLLLLIYFKRANSPDG